MANDILKELNTTSAALLDTLTGFPDDDFNRNFSDDTWSAAQVSEHIYKFVSGVLVQMKVPVVPTSRDPQEKAEILRNIFLDFSVKFKSPEFVLPGNKPVSKPHILEKLATAFDNIAAVIKTQDISPTTTGFELPGLGPATRAEWIWFAIYHTQRHIRQIKNLQAEIETTRHLAGNKEA